MNQQSTIEMRLQPTALPTPSPSVVPPDCQHGHADGEFAQAGFTSGQNPFLYPLDLLQIGEFSSVDSAAAILRVATQTPSDYQDDPHWWLVHTKPRQEKKLATQLGSLGVPHYLPVTKCTAITRGRPRITRAPLFAGYLFLNANSEQRRRALETNRTVALHAVADRVGLVRQLWDLADLIEKGIPLRIEERLVSGQYVRVKSGLLKDKCGVVMKRVGKTRLYVFVNELLGGVSLEIEQHLLEPYGDAPVR